jgi:hypothetical protein
MKRGKVSKRGRLWERKVGRGRTASVASSGSGLVSSSSSTSVLGRSAGGGDVSLSSAVVAGLRSSEDEQISNRATSRRGGEGRSRGKDEPWGHRSRTILHRSLPGHRPRGKLGRCVRAGCTVKREKTESKGSVIIQWHMRGNGERSKTNLVAVSTSEATLLSTGGRALSGDVSLLTAL